MFSTLNKEAIEVTDDQSHFVYKIKISVSAINHSLDRISQAAAYRQKLKRKKNSGFKLLYFKIVLSSVVPTQYKRREGARAAAASCGPCGLTSCRRPHLTRYRLFITYESAACEI